MTGSAARRCTFYFWAKALGKGGSLREGWRIILLYGRLADFFSVFFEFFSSRFPELFRKVFFEILVAFWESLWGHFGRYFRKKTVFLANGGSLVFDRPYSDLA